MGDFQRSASIESNETVGMDNNEIIGMWNDGGEADVVDNIQFCEEIAPSPSASDPVSSASEKDVDGYKSAFGAKGYDQTMEEVRRLKSILERQAKLMEAVKLPVVHYRRRSSVARCA